MTSFVASPLRLRESFISTSSAAGYNRQPTISALPFPWAWTFQTPKSCCSACPSSSVPFPIWVQELALCGSEDADLTYRGYNLIASRYL